MTFPPDTRVGDLFRMNGEPVKVTAWNYLDSYYNDKRYFDIEFISIGKALGSPASMVLIPMGFDFYATEITRMTPLEEQLF